MTGCTRCAQLLSLRLDGPLSPDETMELEDHLSQCPACRTLASRLAAMQSALSELEDLPAPEGFTQGVMDRIRAAEAEQDRPVPLFRRPQIRALAGLAACALVCVGLYRGLPGTSKDAVLRSASTPVSSARTASQSLEELNDRCATEVYRLDAADYDLSGEGGSPEAAQKSSSSPSQFNAPASADSLPVPTGDLGDSPHVSAALYGEFGDAYTNSLDSSEGQSMLLTLERLPEGWEEILGAENPGFDRKEDSGTSQEEADQWEITRAQLEALVLLAREQGIPLSLSDTPDPEGPCALTVAPGP